MVVVSTRSLERTICLAMVLAMAFTMHITDVSKLVNEFLMTSITDIAEVNRCNAAT